MRVWCHQSCSCVTSCAVIQLTVDEFLCPNLRSWNKFVRLYYVDEIVCNDAAMTITITMTVDRDLRLQFSDRNQCVLLPLKSPKWCLA